MELETTISRFTPFLIGVYCMCSYPKVFYGNVLYYGTSGVRLCVHKNVGAWIISSQRPNNKVFNVYAQHLMVLTRRHKEA